MQDDEVTFNVFKAMKYPMDIEDCFRIDAIEKLTRELFQGDIPHYHWRRASPTLTKAK